MRCFLFSRAVFEAFGDDSQCVLTGGTVSDGDCRTSDDGCCDLFVECRDDGICQLPPPVCTADSTCDGVDEACVRGLACVSPDDVTVVFYEPGSSPYLGVFQYESQDFFFAGTISSGSYVLTEFVTFDEEVGANVHMIMDESGRPMSAFVEGLEDDVFIYVYDDNGNLVSVSGVELDGGTGRRGLEMVVQSTSELQHVARRELLGVLVTIGVIAAGGLLAQVAWYYVKPLLPPPPGELS